MAEAIGLISSIIGIAGAAAHYSLAFADIIDRLGSAAENARSISNDLSILSLTLNELADTLQRAENVAEANNSVDVGLKRAQATAQMAIGTARNVIDEIGKITQALDIDPPPQTVEGNSAERKGDNANGSKKSNPYGPMWLLRVKWVFQESKVNRMRSALEGLKSTLILLSTTVNLYISK
jgi:hypothetical protein